MIKAFFLDRFEIALDRPIDVGELLAKPERRKLRDLYAAFRDQASQRGVKDPDANASQELESFLTAAFGEIGNRYLGRKRLNLSRLAEIQGKILEMYRGVMRGRGQVKIDLAALRALYREMQAEFDALPEGVDTVPTSGERPRAQAKSEFTPTETDGREVIGAEVRLNGLKAKEFEPGQMLKSRKWGMIRKLKDKIRVGMTVENGKLSVEVWRDGEQEPISTFKEHDLLQHYKNKPRSTSVIQAHHGCQSSLMRALFGDKYDPGEAPTIWLRDSTGDSPHGLITHAIQNVKEASRITETKRPGFNFQDLRQWAAEDLAAAGAPDDAIHAYLAAVDDYVAKLDLTPAERATKVYGRRR